jgi:hypothetical protein
MDHYSDKEIDELGQKYNKIFTMFQKLDKKLANWTPLSANTKDKWTKILAQQEIDALGIQIELAKIQIKEMKKNTNWFIVLTIVIIITTLINIGTTLWSTFVLN